MRPEIGKDAVERLRDPCFEIIGMKIMEHEKTRYKVVPYQAVGGRTAALGQKFEDFGQSCAVQFHHGPGEFERDGAAVRIGDGFNFSHEFFDVTHAF